MHIKHWYWMMNYCKEHQNPPAQEWAWKQAEIAYLEYIQCNS